MQKERQWKLQRNPKPMSISASTSALLSGDELLGYDSGTVCDRFVNAGRFADAFILGTQYDQGFGVEKSNWKAARCYLMAAEQGLADAQYALGNMYLNNSIRGEQKYLEVSAIWFRKAADQGLADAQNNLGYLYSNGMGVPEDRDKAQLWWEKAAAQGHTLAQDNLRETNKFRCECTYGGIGNLGGQSCGVSVKRRDEITSTYWRESYGGFMPDEIWSCSLIE
jgi:hypothetical protein